MNDDEPEYDVVVDTLQKRIDHMMKMTEANMRMNSFNIMDQIRLSQIDQLEEAIELWKNKNE
jgi:hypothetical protein